MSTSTLRLAAVIAAAVAVTAVAAAAITSAVTDDGTLSAQDVDQLLAGQTLRPSADDNTASPSTSGTGDVASSGGDLVATLVPGVVTVHCDGNTATLVGWSPNSGFRSDDPVRGPAEQVSVRFESDGDADYRVTATCTDGTATVDVGSDDDHGDGDPGDDDHGGSRGPGG